MTKGPDVIVRALFRLEDEYSAQNRVDVEVEQGPSPVFVVVDLTDLVVRQAFFPHLGDEVAGRLVGAIRVFGKKALEKSLEHLAASRTAASQTGK